MKHNKMFLSTPLLVVLLVLANVHTSVCGPDLQEIQCQPSQNCVEKDQCPEVVTLYAQLKEESEEDKRQALITNLQSRVNIYFNF